MNIPYAVAHESKKDYLRHKAKNAAEHILPCLHINCAAVIADDITGQYAQQPQYKGEKEIVLLPERPQLPELFMLCRKAVNGISTELSSQDIRYGNGYRCAYRAYHYCLP